MMSSIEVNCEKMIVLSSPSERESISLKISTILRVFDESGGRSLSLARFAFDTTAVHSMQAPLSPVFEAVSLGRMSTTARGAQGHHSLGLAQLAAPRIRQSHPSERIRQLVRIVVAILAFAHFRLHRLLVFPVVLRDQ